MDDVPLTPRARTFMEVFAEVLKKPLDPYCYHCRERHPKRTQAECRKALLAELAKKERELQGIVRRLIKLEAQDG